MSKDQVEYIIVKDDGKGQARFLELFNNKWGVLNSYATGNAVHYIMKRVEESKIVMPAEDKALVHNFGRQREK